MNLELMLSAKSIMNSLGFNTFKKSAYEYLTSLMQVEFFFFVQSFAG